MSAVGTIVYVKKFRSSPGKNYGEYTMRKPLACLSLGTTDENLSAEEVFKTALDAGFVRTDDIAEALGEKAFEKLSKWLVKKYGKAES